MRKILSFLLALVMILSLSVTAFAADDIGVVEYRRKSFSFGPGFWKTMGESTLSYPTDLFPAFKDVMPGDEIHQQVKITHKGSRGVNIRVYIKAEGSDPKTPFDENFLKTMDLKVQHKKGEILYDKDYDATEKSEWKKLATLAPGKSTTLDLTLTVPLEMGNEFQETYGDVLWKFKVEEIPIDDTNAKTGDYIMNAVAVLVLSAAALVVLVVLKKKKKK